MVRLVFRPYTQVWRPICTSGPRRTSTRVSSGFILLGHSSPSFGSQQMCSCSNPLAIAGTVFGSAGNATSFHQGFLPLTLTFITRPGLTHPNTRTFVGLLGPCYKTGRWVSFRQRPWPADNLKWIEKFKDPTRQLGCRISPYPFFPSKFRPLESERRPPSMPRLGH